MNREIFEHYLRDDSRQGDPPADAFSGSVGGAACGDLVRISVAVEGWRVAGLTFDSEGCAAARAAAAATAELVEGHDVVDAARIGPSDVAAELGGLSPQGRHAADLAADALHRALTAFFCSPRPAVGGNSQTDRDPSPYPANPSRDTVLVAMSGGVDSAVAALLERDAGNDVIAVTLKLWADQHNDGEKSCCSPQAVIGARGVAHSLGLSHLTMDLEDEFRAAVVDPFVAGYAAGRTPNPCVRCNGSLRLDAMLALAQRLGAAGLATGHYARVIDDGEGSLLAPAADASKDQTYMLSALAPASLERMRFPLADLTKPEVREIAHAAGLPVAAKADSQDLCFLAGEGRRGFLARHGGLADRPGPITDRSGRELGRHRGHHHFTVGQRRGIGVASREPLYVLETDAAANRVVVGTHPELGVSNVAVRDAVLHRDAGQVDAVKLRYRSKPMPALVEPARAPAGRHDWLSLRLREPAFGVAPGQVASLMSGGAIVGHATIDAAY